MIHTAPIKAFILAFKTWFSSAQKSGIFEGRGRERMLCRNAYFIRSAGVLEYWSTGVLGEEALRTARLKVMKNSVLQNNNPFQRCFVLCFSVLPGPDQPPRSEPFINPF
jgi:hypothetical protein